ncbi:MAG: hypothetical protein KGL43_26750 [Burkholderiales bacterium]|nr:hypothetical protein [Burkholderiales bacterium]
MAGMRAQARVAGDPLLGATTPASTPSAPSTLVAVFERVREGGGWQGRSRRTHDVTDHTIPVFGPDRSARRGVLFDPDQD